MKIQKRTKTIFIIALIACLVSMAGTALMQNNLLKTKVTSYTITLTDLADMIRENNAANGKAVDITFTENSDYKFSFLVFKPKTASSDNPAPAVMASHGGANSREMQLPTYIELARRGFVVIAIDAAGHGHSDNAIMGLTHDSYGMEAAAEYAMSLDYVDESKIGVTGHSMGNDAAGGTVRAINTGETNNHVSAFLCGAGTLGALAMSPETTQDLIFGIATDKLDEFDTFYVGSYHFLETDMAKDFITWVYPSFNDSKVSEGAWYTSEGIVDQPVEGTALGVSRATAIYNPAITHPGFHFSLTGTRIIIRFFYDAFGTPPGAKLLPSTNQIWWVAVCFQLLGLFGFFALMFPLVAMLMKTPLFADIKQPIKDKADLPSLKNWKEWVPFVLTISALVLFAFFTYPKMYTFGSSEVFNPDIYPSGVANGVAYWTLANGLFLMVMILVNYGLKALLYGKDRSSLGNPFSSAALKSVSHFFKICLLAITTIGIMYIPVFIAYYVFHADFRICSLVIALPELAELPIILLRYLPLWIIFYVPNAILNANTRFKDVPDWLSTLICSIGNSLALIVFIALQYGHLLSSGLAWKPAAGMGGIVAWAVAPALAFAAWSARFVYKKTGSAWAAGLINALVMCLATCALTQFSTDLIFPF